MAGTQISGNITVNGAKRTYIGYLPTSLGKNRPLMISCHGMNQDAAYQKNMLAIESVADTAKFLTIFPQGEGNSWDISGDKDIRFVEALIDKMVELYQIDANSVYLSGFSMGGMFTYHAMNKIPHKIAAFAPISGYSMWGTTAGANVRPLPIIHTHGTGDDVVGFSGVQGALNVWISHNGCPAKATVVKKYRGAPHITRHTWGPGKEGVEVVLMEMADKGHWISNDYGVKTGDEIWKFCKRYQLVQKNPTVRFTSPSTGLTYISMGGKSDIPAVTLTATASDPDGTVASVAFYNGSTLLASFDEAPYTFELTGLKKGSHNLRAVVTDDEGRTGEAMVSIEVVEPVTYQLHQTFANDGSVPDGWSTYDGKDLRQGYSDGYTSGSRLFEFTGANRDFTYGLYTRNQTGDAKAGYARFADEGTSVSLELHSGKYQLSYKVCNWNCPSFSPVTLAIETIDGKAVFIDTFTPTANVGNKASNSFSGSKVMTSKFDILDDGRYVVTFYTADVAWADLVVGPTAIAYKGKTTGVEGVQADDAGAVSYFTLSGVPVTCPVAGIYIERRTTADGTAVSRKVIF